MTHARRARLSPGRPPRDERESGAAMIVAVMVITVVAVLSTSIAVLATRSTRAAGETRTAGVVKDLANAGLAEGVTFLRQVGVTPAIEGLPVVPDGLGACATPTVNTTSPSWTQSGAAVVDGGDQGDYTVWVEKVAAPSGGNPGSYRVCAQGESGEGKRVASVRTQYTPAAGSAGPYAVYGKGDINLQSAAQVISNMSVYSETCIDRKGNKQTVGGTDLAAVPARPAAAHAMKRVLGGSGPDNCADPSIHAGSDFVDNEFHYDTDSFGGLVAGDPDLAGHSELSNPTLPWKGSTLEPTGQTLEQFRAKWGVPDMLSATSINALEQTAKQQGNYHYLTSSTTSSVTTPNEDHAVVFLDFQNHESVDLDKLTFVNPWVGSGCPTGKSLILVLRNADAEGNGNRVLRASVVIKNGGFTKLNGGFRLIGGLFADGGLDLSGTGNVELDACAISNPPPAGTPKVDVSNYVEYDRG